MPEQRSGHVDAPIGSLVAGGVFEPGSIYFDTPTYGLAPSQSVEAVLRAVEDWQRGTARMDVYDDAVKRARGLFAEITRVSADSVAIGAQVSALVGPIAAAVPAGSRVLVPDGEFTSLLFPFLVNQHRGLEVRAVPLTDLADAIDAHTDVVAFSLVQSSTGQLAGLEDIRDAAGHHGAVTVVDATHAAGWFPFEGTEFDFTLVAAYKWLLCPRGTAFLIHAADSKLDVPSMNAGWYAGEAPWESIYGLPLRLAVSSRRYDMSPAWFSWMGAVPSLELIASIGVEQIHQHNLALADRLRQTLGLPPSGSAIVTLEATDASELSARGITAAVRADSVRIGCHLYNTSGEVDSLVTALESRDSS